MNWVEELYELSEILRERYQLGPRRPYHDALENRFNCATGIEIVQ